LSSIIDKFLKSVLQNDHQIEKSVPCMNHHSKYFNFLNFVAFIPLIGIANLKMVSKESIFPAFTNLPSLVTGFHSATSFLLCPANYLDLLIDLWY